MSKTIIRNMAKTILNGFGTIIAIYCTLSVAANQLVVGCFMSLSEEFSELPYGIGENLVGMLESATLTGEQALLICILCGIVVTMTIRNIVYAVCDMFDSKPDVVYTTIEAD